jgi:hypothetical protein
MGSDGMPFGGKCNCLVHMVGQRVERKVPLRLVKGRIV